jgi:formylglycine-generating enzyme required for sulfatase activity
MQWEKAARGTDARRYPYGNELNELSQNTRSYGYRDTLDVGTLTKGPSPYGALDMLGNAWEWCDTPYAAYPGNPGAFPVSEKQTYVIRGGSYLTPPLKSSLAISMRSFLVPDFSQEDVGFRCVAPVEGQ